MVVPEDGDKRVALASALALLVTGSASAQDVVRLGNLKFAHYGAISYMKDHCGKFGLKVEEIVFPKGIDIFPAIVKGEVDIAASAADAAVAPTFSGRAGALAAESGVQRVDGPQPGRFAVGRRNDASVLAIALGVAVVVAGAD